MRVPFSLTANMAGYLTTKSLSGDKKFPLVMMLEPLHACNLTCTGCGRIREYKSTINELLTVEQCMAAVGRLRRADRFHLRRRAADLSGNRTAG